MDIKELHQAGVSIRQLAKQTGHSRNTVRKVLRGEHTGEYQRKRPAETKIGPFREYVKERFDEYGLSAIRLIEEIEPMGYEGSLSTLRRYLRELRKEKSKEERLTVRFETAPGKQAQADWGYVGKFEAPDGRIVKVYVFVMVLSHSRKLYIEFTTSMKMHALLKAHTNAFEYFGGWPESILYDNMKQVRINRGTWNIKFTDFTDHYGIVPKTHRAYRPRTKGKVERMVDYVKDNFLRGREFADLEDLKAQGRHWLEHTANARVHGTTKRIPEELFREQEADRLTPHGTVPAYCYVEPVQRQVSFEAMVHYDGSRYSVPPSHAGQSVEVLAADGAIRVRLGDAIIAEHPKATKSGQCITNREHIAELWRLTADRVPVPEKKPLCQIAFSQQVDHVDLAELEALAL
jgi:transposase